MKSDVIMFLFPVIGVSGFFLGGLDTASNSLVIYMLGPQGSPPFTQVSSCQSGDDPDVLLVSVSARHGGVWLHARLYRDPALLA